MRSGTRNTGGSRIVGALAVCAMAVLATPGVAGAAIPAPGDLDHNFAGTGKTTLDVQREDGATAVAIDGQHRIVVAGWARAAKGDFVVARYMPDGNLDPSFGTDGIVTTDFNGRDDTASAMAIDPQGRIVLAGTTRGPRGGSYAALARYRPTGDLDPSFDGDGKAVVSLGGYDTQVNAMAIDPKGRIVVAGRRSFYHDVFNALDVVVARFDSHGALDPAFGRDGKVTTDFGQMDFAFALALDPLGRIVIAGESEFETASFIVARYGPNGALDPSFGEPPRFEGDSYSDSAHAVTVDSEGRVLAAGGVDLASGDSSGEFALARYAGGKLDPSFGTDGTVTTAFSRYSDANAVLADNEGRIVAAGTNTTPALDQKFAIARYRADGSLDGSFGSGGKVTTAFSGSNAQGTAVAMDDRGRIVVVGRASESDTESKFAVARYIGRDKAPPEVHVRGHARFRTARRTGRAHFRLVASEPADFECKVDDGNFRPCSSPYRTRRLAIGRHRLKVHATDEAGNVGDGKRRFRIVARD